MKILNVIVQLHTIFFFCLRMFESLQIKILWVRLKVHVSEVRVISSEEKLYFYLHKLKILLVWLAFFF